MPSTKKSGDMTTLYFILFILGSLPVIGYPIILFYNITCLSGYQPKSTPRIMMVMMKSFMWATTLYPIIYFFALYKYINTDPETHFIWAGVILLCLSFMILTFKGWMVTERKYLKNRNTKNRDTL